MSSSPHSHQNVAILLVILMAALAGGAIVHMVEAAQGVRVQLGPDGEEIHVWNPTTSSYAECAITLDDQYVVQTSTIPKRTLLTLPRRLFAAPEDWAPERAVVRCQLPRFQQWAGRVQH